MTKVAARTAAPIGVNRVKIALNELIANKNRWSVNEPGAWIGDEKSSRFEPLIPRALAQELITPSKAAGLLGVSLPELGDRYTPVD